MHVIYIISSFSWKALIDHYEKVHQQNFKEEKGKATIATGFFEEAKGALRLLVAGRRRRAGGARAAAVVPTRPIVYSFDGRRAPCPKIMSRRPPAASRATCYASPAATSCRCERRA